jgi:hypothetical protein
VGTRRVDFSSTFHCIPPNSMMAYMSETILLLERWY